MYKLVIADDEGKTTVVPLVRDEITIGRKEGNTIRLTERNVSRKHAKLRKANGAYVVEDLQSYNGVKVNGRRIGGEIQLKAGDQITIGDYQLALQVDDAPAIPETAPPAVAMPNGHPDAATAMMQAPALAPPVVAPAVGPRPPPRLVMTSPPAPGAEFALARPLTRIGRAEDLDVWINHRSISREHAEIANDNGVFRIRDLGSANGVRVNGREVQQAELKPGDTIELGQVRFRFVGLGEQFVFDTERTMQVDAIAPERPPNRLPFLAAGGLIIGVAVIVAGIVIFSRSLETEVGAIEQPSPMVVPPTPAFDPGTAAAAPGVPVDAMVTACQAALNAGQFDVAMQRAAEALAIQPDHARALACQQQVEQQRAESDAYARGLALLNGGDLEGAYFAFEELPPGSSYRSRPEVSAAMRRFAESKIQEAEGLIESDPEAALRLAQTVLDMTSVDSAMRRRASDVQRRASGRVRVAVTGSRPERVGPRQPARGGSTPGSGGSTAPPATGGGRSTAESGSGGGPAVGAAGEGQPLIQQARACLAAGGGGNPCVLRVLENRARSPEEMAMLIATYQAMGNTPRMLDTMEQFVRRHSDHPRAVAYRQALARHGR